MFNFYFETSRYCNSRIVKFDAKGTYIGQAGDDELWVPHSLALAEDLDLICVADRENRRYAGQYWRNSYLIIIFDENVTTEFHTINLPPEKR